MTPFPPWYLELVYRRALIDSAFKEAFCAATNDQERLLVKPFIDEEIRHKRAMRRIRYSGLITGASTIILFIVMILWSV